MALLGCDFCKFVNYESSDDFYLYELGTCACNPGYSYEHYVVKRCILHFVVKGKGRLVLDGKEYSVHAHQAFLIPENAHAFYQADEEDPWEYVWFHIGGPKHVSIFKEAGLDYNNPIYTPMGCIEEIEALAFDILKHYDREYYCIGSLYKLCDYLIHNSENKAKPTVDDSLLYVKNVISYIQLKYAEPMMRSHYGNCYSWASVFMYLTRWIGFDTRCQSGTTGKSNNAHGWTEINFNGELFIFDPEMENSSRKAGNKSFHKRYYKLPYNNSIRSYVTY